MESWELQIAFTDLLLGLLKVRALIINANKYDEITWKEFEK